jgi:hypothetical protein
VGATFWRGKNGALGALPARCNCLGWKSTAGLTTSREALLIQGEEGQRHPVSPELFLRLRFDYRGRFLGEIFDESYHFRANTQNLPVCSQNLAKSNKTILLQPLRAGFGVYELM